MNILPSALRRVCGAIFPVVLLLSGCGDKGAGTSDGRTATTPHADDSGKNARDRNDATLTAGDQGTTPADREITQKIRKALVSDTAYSTTAKNVKIITVNGKVSLRGPVKTPAEKMGIVTMARVVAGDSNVEDQLEVKANP